MARCADPLLKAAAERELAGPTAGADQAALADAWAEAARAQAQPSPAKDAMQRKALHWYQEAEKHLAGLPKSAVTKKILDLRLSRLQRGGLLGDYFNGTGFSTRRFSRIDPRVEYNWGYDEPEASLNRTRYSVRWTGFIRAAAGQYSFVAVHDDAMRIWVDGQAVVDQWKTGTYRNKALVVLNGGFQELRIEYAQFGGDAHAGLGWIPPAVAKLGKAKPIPPEMLYHDPLLPGPVFARPPADQDGRISLEPKSARIVGSHMAYTAANGRMPDYLGDWTSTASYATWDFDVRTEGDYAVMVNYASGGKRAGSRYEVNVSGLRFPGVFVDTGGIDGAEDFKAYQVGLLHLAPGGQTLQFRTTLKKNKMNLPPLGKVDLVLRPAK